MRRRDRPGTMIRHGSLAESLPVGSLTMPMSPPACFRLLVSMVGRAPLLPTRLLPTCFATVALPSVALPAEPEQSSTGGGAAPPLEENGFWDRRHDCLNRCT